MNKSEELLKGVGIVLALIGWLWTVGIVLDNSTPSYIRQAGLLLTLGSLMTFYFMNKETH